MKPKLPLKKQIAYALGQFGWSLLSGIIGSYLVFFYIPTKESGIGLSIPQVTIFGFLTLIGLITMLGRFFDAITDPLIATWSDRCKSKKGRRIFYLMISSLPFAVFTVLVFCPPFKGQSPLNAVWLTVTLLLYYLFITMYVTPFFALMSELGHTPEERLNLSTYISATWFLGAAVASQAPAIWNIFVNMGYEKATAMRIAFIILAAIAFIFLIIPVLFIDEKKYCESIPSTEDVFQSLKATFKNKEFDRFVFSDLAYWVAMTVFQTGLIYYVTILLDKTESMYGLLFMLLGVGSFIFYAPVNIIAKKIGKKTLLIIAFVMFMIIYVYSFFLGKLPFSTSVQAYLMVILASIPMAIFGILPNAVIADIAEYDAKKTGSNREAMFFGARTFMSKMGQMVAMLLFSSLTLLGKDKGDDLGIRLTTIVAAVFCVIGFLLLLTYNEKKILDGIKIDKKE